MQLEEELRLRRAEIQTLQTLQGQPRSPDPTAPGSQPTSALLPAGSEHTNESGALKEKYEAALAACQQEIDSLKAVVDKQNQEICEMKQKAQQATRENMEMMDTWKVVLLFIHQQLQPLEPTVSPALHWR